MKKLFNPLKSVTEKGQGLVEMAIVTPILIFMLLGVFEVGWALRGYLVLTNVNREVTRYAIRPNYLNYSDRNNNPPTATFPITPAYVSVGYNRVMSYTYSTLADQLPLVFSTGVTSSTMIISHMVIDTGMPCKNMANCDCSKFVTDPNYISDTNIVKTFDDLILHPGVPGYEYYYSAKFPSSSTLTTKYNYEQEALNLKRQNNKFNCELLKKSTSTLPSANNVIITEIYYNQPQIFGFPLISNPLTDPVPMYAHTAMRMIVASRTGENVDTVGPTCSAYPITFKQDVLDVLGPNPPIYPDFLGPYQTFDIWEGDAAGNFGWITWNPNQSNNNAGYVAEELEDPRMALNDYTNATNPNDHSLSIGDDVSTKPGVANSSDVNDLLISLVGQEILIPVYSVSPGSGQNTYYHITHFAKVVINDYCLAAGGALCGGQNKNKINATFLGYYDEACPVN